MNEEELEEEKKSLVEELGIRLEHENLAPVAARILVTLILEGSRGTTFDALVENLNAGKSTVSTHLDQLQASGKVEYFTRPGDRKRYFIINPHLMLKRADEMIAGWVKEKEINEKIIHYKESWNRLHKNQSDFQYDIDFQKDYLAFIDEATKSIERLRIKIKEKNLTNHNK